MPPLPTLTVVKELSAMNIYSIYKVTNKINKKAYIGYSKDPESRWKGHIYETNSGHKNKFHNAIRKYGAENFIMEIIYQGWDEGYVLNEMKVHFIKELNTLNEGYNSTPGGEKPPVNTGHSEETKRKIGAAHKGRKNPHAAANLPETQGMNNPMYGKSHSDETKKKISQSNKGKKPVITKERNRKISEALKGRDITWGDKISQNAKNRRKGTCPHCGKTMDVGNLSRYHNDRCKSA